MKNEALLIVDMSNDFVHEKGSLTAGEPAQKIVPYIVETAQTFLENEGLVVVTMDAHQENDAHFELWPPHNVVGSWGQKLYGELETWYEQNKSNKRLFYVPKENYNAFHGTDLKMILNGWNVDKVHVVGVCTDICDFLTLAGADANGFKTAVHDRGSATFTKHHELFLEQAKLCFHTEIIR
ncbi:cysteine hydrolase family protein [Chengkuizengella axinellae]|uniref:Isochorismatase family cysteine hydrolase n=1 Tax=Chengkuizengella axinellae TaxID=3064388 RepID=A0ABT9IW21_9BACL|nr:isochorismatase family cysteine hydrolase [Chengkuizengella sp. 2205SS18-9]MDP5272985.1 isochorismatase family cysteine hydrolase [Chengkuizengella sp. 2205SS18-9]